ncbi:hypothetical protein B0O80DRAFT_493598 [Mortierella sp. GBAus27b]|nr:hypothetical protein B0O80DRAFT_493598 [Mortierella sp. GBAus27b]
MAYRDPKIAHSMVSTIQLMVPHKNNVPKRTGESVTCNEFCIVACVFSMISTAPLEVQQWIKSLGVRSRDQLQTLTGLNKTACDAAIRFADSGVLETSNKGVGRGRKKKALDLNITKELRTIVDDANRQGIPTSADRIENELREKGIEKSTRTITRYLRAEGYFWDLSEATGAKMETRIEAKDIKLPRTTTISAAQINEVTFTRHLRVVREHQLEKESNCKVKDALESLSGSSLATATTFRQVDDAVQARKDAQGEVRSFNSQ